MSRGKLTNTQQEEREQERGQPTVRPLYGVCVVGCPLSCVGGVFGVRPRTIGRHNCKFLSVIKDFIITYREYMSIPCYTLSTKKHKGVTKMVRVEITGYKKIERNGKTLYYLSALAIDPIDEVVGIATYNAFVRASHLKNRSGV